MSPEEALLPENDIRLEREVCWSLNCRVIRVRRKPFEVYIRAALIAHADLQTDMTVQIETGTRVLNQFIPVYHCQRTHSSVPDVVRITT